MEDAKEGKEITIREAERLSGLTAQWLRDLVIRGTLPGRKLGRIWYLDREALERYIDRIGRDAQE